MRLALGTPPSDLVPLLFPTPAVLAAADAMLPGACAGPWAMPPVPRWLQGSGLPGHAGRQIEPSRFNELAWPAWGMSRWAVGHFLASAAQAEAIRTLAFGEDGDEVVALTLRMSAEWAGASADAGADVSTVVDHRVHVLPPKVIGRADPLHGQTTDGLYAITVVDERYRLARRPAPTDLAITAETTWDDLLTALAAEVLRAREGDADPPSDPVLTWEAIPADPEDEEAEFCRPHPSLLDGRFRSLPMLVDAVAASVGMRVVARRDGTFHAMDAAASLAIRNDADIDGAGNPVIRPRLAGGILRAEVL